jgi:hypothetical protein
MCDDDLVLYILSCYRHMQQHHNNLQLDPMLSQLTASSWHSLSILLSMPMLATRPTQLIFLDVMTLTISGDVTLWHEWGVTLTYDTVQHKMRQEYIAVVWQLNHIWHHCEGTHHHDRLIPALNDPFTTNQSWAQEITLQPKIMDLSLLLLGLKSNNLWD